MDEIKNINEPLVDDYIDSSRGNDNYKYFLYSAVAIVSIFALYVAWLYVSSDKDFGFEIEWKFWKSSILWPILSFIGFFLQFLDWQHTSFKEGWVVKDSWGREKFVENNDIMSSMFGGCVWPLISHFFLIPCAYGAALYYLIILPLALLNALIPYLAALFCIVMAVFFYKIAKNLGWKSHPLLKLFFAMVLFLLLISAVSIPTSYDFESNNEESVSQSEYIGYAKVTTKVANLRTGPGTDYEICMQANGEKLQVRQGDEIKILEDTGDWFKILLSDNETAYIKKTLCSDINYNQTSLQTNKEKEEISHHENTDDNTLENRESINEQAVNEEIQSADSNIIKLYGAVDKYPITMQLSIDGSVVKGTYYYNKQGPDRILKLYGSLNGLEMELFESDENGNQIGHFKGNFSDGEYYGEFVNIKGKSMPFRVSM
ncbi:MAG: hypothetical protein IKK92_01220 [Prevotella sp.]|nr:hypothetical protein [Prevotella sp.]